MTVIRVAPGIEKHFFMASNEFARDPSIPARAAKVYIYLVSHQEGWEVSVRSVAKATGMGKNTVAAALRDLEAAGYIDRMQVKGEYGHFAGTEYMIHRERQPRTQNRDTDNNNHKPENGTRTDRQECDIDAGQDRNPENGTPKNGQPFSGSHKKTNSSKKTKDQEDQEEKLPIVPQEGRANYPDAFEVFWKTYPRRVGKRAAFKAWERAVKRSDEERVLVGAETVRDDPNLPEERFIPHPTTWLNRDGWEDVRMPIQEAMKKSAAEVLAEWGYSTTPEDFIEGEVIDAEVDFDD